MHSDGSTSSSIDPDLRFWKAEGMRQLRIQSGEDLKLLKALDPKLWVVLSCPTHGLEFDETTLRLIDTDGDGRIKCQEMIDAVEWALGMLNSCESLSLGQDSIALSLINDSHEEGARLLQSARRILINHGKPEAVEVSLADTLDTASIFSAVKYNGDGIIPPQAAENREVRQIIEDILNTVGGETDRGGAKGVSSEGVERFFDSLKNYCDWIKREEASKREIMVFGEDTAVAFESFKAIACRIEEFFAKSRLASFDNRAMAAFNSPKSDFSSFDSNPIAKINDFLRDCPLSRIKAESRLSFSEGINPFYEELARDFRNQVVNRLWNSDKSEISLEDWKKIKTTFAPYAEWVDSKSGDEVEKLGLDRIEAIQASGHREILEGMIAEDRAIAAEIDAVAEVEKLIRFHRDLFRLANNFVALPDFYHLRKKAIFQAGTLTMDGRDFNLCLYVEDAGRHAAISRQAGIYLLYCELKGQVTEEKRLVAAAVTSGTSNRLAVGKNGLFRDRQGKDWEATVVKIESHPIGVREAIIGPFKRLGQLIAAQIEKISSTREKAFQGKLTDGISAVDKNVSAGSASPTTTSTGGGMGGVLAGGGVAIAALSSSFAFITSTLSNVDVGTILYTAVVFLMFILMPPAILSLLKLRKRDLSLVLEACGWAINGPMRLNFTLSRMLTRHGVYPDGHKRGVRWWVLGLLAGVLLIVYLRNRG